MRLKTLSCAVSAGVLALGSLPTSAATVIHGTSNGTTISFDSPPLDSPFQAGKTKVSLDIVGGNFVEGGFDLYTRYSYSIYDSTFPDLDQGNTTAGTESCRFGSGPIACTNEYGEADLFHLSNFLVGPTHLEFAANLPRSYDRCGNLFDVICSESWTSFLSGEFTVTNPVRYKLTFSNLDAVPEPASWAMMIAGFGMMGAVMRRRQSLSRLAVV